MPGPNQADEVAGVAGELSALKRRLCRQSSPNELVQGRASHPTLGHNGRDLPWRHRLGHEVPLPEVALELFEVAPLLGRFHTFSHDGKPEEVGHGHQSAHDLVGAPFAPQL